MSDLWNVQIGDARYWTSSPSGLACLNKGTSKVATFSFPDAASAAEFENALIEVCRRHQVNSVVGMYKFGEVCPMRGRRGCVSAHRLRSRRP